MSKNFWGVILLFSLTSIVLSNTINYRYYFNPPQLLEDDGKTIVLMEGAVLTGIEGEPQLPIVGGNLLLPPGQGAVQIHCQSPQPVILGSGYYVAPVQEQHPLSVSGPFEATPENPLIYNSNDYYPQNLVQNLQTQYFRGYSLACFTLHPVIYNPAQGELAYYPYMDVTVETQSSPAPASAYNDFYRGRLSDRELIAGKVDNPQQLGFYAEVLDETDDGEAYYLIITDEELHSTFETLAEYKIARGTSTEIVLKEWILSNYTGIDAPTKIRNCIINYYQSHGTEYVLMAGDVENVPKRGLYAAVGGEVDYDMAADLYFGCLDGNWDANGNGIYGEPQDNPDLVAEVYVGRASADSPDEALRFINKQIAYQHTPVADELAEGLMLGEDLEWLSWGSDYKEEIRLGSSSWGYTTVGFPNYFEVGTLYDTPAFHWSAIADLLPLLNEGPQLVNHLGHANNTYALKFNGVDVNDNNMTNNGINHNFYLIYSQGCYCNSWDNRLPNGATTGSEAIAEAWTTINNGAVCFIGNTRYGWGDYSSTNGSSQLYDRQFFDAIFGEGIFEIGRAHQDSKEDGIPFINYGANRWCYYECCLLGDPTLEIWTDVPQTMTVDCDTFINLGAANFAVSVVGEAGALCAISQSGQLLGSALTNASGNTTVNFSSPLASSEQLRLIVTKHNRIPYDTYLDVYIPNAPNILFNACEVYDINGDDDGILDLGEESYLNLTITNFGGMDAQSETAVLATEDYYISINDGAEMLGNIGHDQTATFAQAFNIRAESDVPDGHIANFALEISDGQGHIWNYDFDLPVTAPILILTDVDLDDGNDLRLTAGETAQITTTLTNIGAGEGRLIEGYLDTDNPYLIIDPVTGNLDLLTNGQSGALNPVFSVTATANCPLSANIPVYLNLTDGMGYIQSQMFEIIVGGILENFENGIGEWTHEAVGSGWSDQWVMTDYRNYTPGGAYSWHCGPPDGSNYANHLNSALVSPEYEILDGATLTFRHWMNAEVSQSNPGYCYDGGIVEIKLDTCIFAQIYPVGGYNYYIRDYPDMGPFATSTPVYSGEIIWEEAVFDLNIYPNWPAHFRFRFGSNGTGTREGWYIDDVEVLYMAPIQTPANFAGVMSDSVTVHLTWNSPGTGASGMKTGNRETDGLLGYRVYRNDEMIADNVGGLWYDDDLRPLPTGTYAYQVTALFAQGESEPTEPIAFDWVDLGIDPGENTIPVNYFIKANYPNPFNACTKIEYGLPETGIVKLAVYDLLGRVVAVLQDGEQAAGIHIALWPAGDHSSGLYFYQLKVENKFQGRGKMLLIK